MTAVTITLDTQPPANPVISLASGATYTGTQSVVATLSTPSADVEEMKLWGDVDLLDNLSVQDTEGNSSWVAYATTYALVLDSGDGLKTVFAKFRDDLGNETATFSDSIQLDTDIPVVEIVSGLTTDRVSKVSPHDVASLSWQCTHAFTDYMVRVVPAVTANRQMGSLIGTANGSANTSGTGVFPADTPIVTTINAADLEAASPGDGPKIIKIFCLSSSTSEWSV